jgi:hypothetical protein
MGISIVVTTAMGPTTLQRVIHGTKALMLGSATGRGWMMYQARMATAVTPVTTATAIESAPNTGALRLRQAQTPTQTATMMGKGEIIAVQYVR